MIDNPVFLVFAIPSIALLTGIACWDLRHHAVAAWAAGALAVIGVAWHGAVAWQADEPALLLMAPFGIFNGAVTVVLLLCMIGMGVGRWPASRGGLLLLPAIGICLGPFTGALGIVAGMGIGFIGGAVREFTCAEPVARRRTPLVACVVAGVLIVFAFMPPYARAQEDGAAGDAGTVTESERLAGVVLGPDVDPGPPGADEHMTALVAAEPLTLAEAAARLEALTLLAVEIEERPSRTGITHSLDAPPPARIDLEGSLVEIVDRLAALYGHRWEWRVNTIVLYRYWDAEFAASTVPPAPREASWEIDLAEHPSLRAVFESWAAEAGWALTWAASRDYSLAADARFTGTFLAAVDSVLADPATRGTLTATAYEANRQLVIEEVP